MAITQVEAALPRLVFHRASPEAEPYKVPGDAVTIGDTIALVEVMKSYISIEVEIAGTFKTYPARMVKSSRRVMPYARSRCRNNLYKCRDHKASLSNVSTYGSK
jgi:acetyl-CoA carboxylase biotin carboxyl carrier protein